MEVEEIVSQLKNIDLSTYPLEEVRELLESIGKKADICVHLRRDYSIFRGRPNKKGENFTNISDYSYRPEQYNSTYQRASTPNQTAFYGVIFENNVKGKAEEARGVVFGEIFHKEIDLNETPKISFGRWEIKEGEQLNLIAIIQEDLYKNKNNLINELIESYDRFINNCSDENLKNKTMKYNTFLANEFSKTYIEGDWDYMISAIYSELVYNNPYFDGILYPSVRAVGRCFNIAIKPQAVDSKMRLEAYSTQSIEEIEGRYRVL